MFNEAGIILNLVFPSLDVQCRVDAAKIDGAVIASDFPTDATCAELVGDWCI